MRWLFDRTNFPLLRLGELGLDVQLLPVTKIQFERFLSEPNRFDDVCYKELLNLNPRISYKSFTIQNRENIFISGLIPDEIKAFMAWMDDGLSIPTVEQWRKINAVLLRKKFNLKNWERLFSLCKQAEAEQALKILQQLKEQLNPSAWLDLTLMMGGLTEWVLYKDRWVGLGSPRSEFYPNLWNPLSDIVEPFLLDLRIPFFGFRLIRKIT